MSQADDPPPVLVDIARGRVRKPVADGAPSGATWLEIDLGARFSIHTIVLAGDVGGPVTSDDFAVAFSADGLVWTEPGVAFRHVGAGAAAAFITADPASWARHVRVAVLDPARIDAVQVRAEENAVDLIGLRKTLALNVTLLHEAPDANVYTSYSLQGSARRTSGALVGLSLFENGAFGNCLVQYFIAVSVARALNLKYITVPKVDRSKVIFLTSRLVCEGNTFIPPDEDLPDDGYFLSGLFFDPTQFHRLVTLQNPPDMKEIVHSVIRPLFNGLPARVPEKPDDQLIIHIRSGDIFSTWVDPHYPQPPFAFYRMVIDRMLAEGRIRSVKLVFENRLNPVIAEVEAYAEDLGLPVTTQSESLVADVAALVNGRYLVFGLGTFGPAICHLSERVDQVFYFSSGSPQGFQAIPTIGKVVEVRDLASRYIKVGQWQNTEAQRRMMVEYPIDDLVFDDAA